MTTQMGQLQYTRSYGYLFWFRRYTLSFIWSFYKAYQKVFHEDLDIYALWKQSRIYSNEIYPKYLNKLITKDELSIYRLKNAFKDFHQFITNQQALDFQKVYEDQQAHLALSSTMKELLTT